MKISSINNITFLSKNLAKEENHKKNKPYLNMGIVASTTSLGGAIGIINHKTKRKTFIAEIKKYYSDILDDVEKRTIKTKSIRDEVGEIYEEKEIRQFHMDRHSLKHKEKLTEIRNSAKKSFKNNIKYGLGIGLFSGGAIIGLKYFLSNKNNTRNIELPPSSSEKLTKNNFFLNNMQNRPAFVNFTSEKVSFTGREIAGSYYTDEQIKIAKRISKSNLKNWPDGLNLNNRYYYGIDNGRPIREIPKNDREYQEILLKQEIVVPPRPPEYYRNYQKWFNTQTWQDMQTWPDYLEKKEDYDKTYQLMNYYRLVYIEEEKIRLDQLKQLHINSAYAKHRIAKEFLLYLNSETIDKPVDLPNAIMIEGRNKEENINTIKWIVGKANAKPVYIDNEGIDNEIGIARIETALETALDNYNKNGKRTIIYVHGFDKLITKNKTDENIISDMKELLCKINKEYKAILLFETEDSSKLDSIALQSHRVRLKFNLNKNITPAELEKLQIEYLKSNLNKIPNSDGYRFDFLPGQNNFVNLYLANFGACKDTLWIDSNSPEKIKPVADFIDAIKSIDIFSKIKKIQCIKPTSFEILGGKFKPTAACTKEFERIYEMTL